MLHVVMTGYRNIKGPEEFSWHILRSVGCQARALCVCMVIITVFYAMTHSASRLLHDSTCSFKPLSPTVIKIAYGYMSFISKQ